MTRPAEPDEGPAPHTGSCAAARIAAEPATDCPRCRALEERIAALEAEVAALRAAAPAAPPSPVPSGPTPAIHPPGLEAERTSEREDERPELPRLEFRALRLFPHGWGAEWGLRPSPARRAWMDEHEHAYHCLPMVIANQWGWQVTCPADVRATWDGTPGPEGLRVEVDPQYAPAIKSQFGTGILTFSPPWLFRTPPGWDLYLKGPSNRWKPNCHPLEGIIETWWLNYTFTINWRLIEPWTIAFAKGESLGQLVPVPHATFRDATATEAPIGLVEPEAARELLAWLERRQAMIGQAVNVHKLYRRAEGVEDHLRKVDVPAIRSFLP